MHRNFQLLDFITLQKRNSKNIEKKILVSGGSSKKKYTDIYTVLQYRVLTDLLTLKTHFQSGGLMPVRVFGAKLTDVWHLVVASIPSLPYTCSLTCQFYLHGVPGAVFHLKCVY